MEHFKLDSNTDNKSEIIYSSDVRKFDEFNITGESRTTGLGDRKKLCETHCSEIIVLCSESDCKGREELCIYCLREHNSSHLSKMYSVKQVFDEEDNINIKYLKPIYQKNVSLADKLTEELKSYISHKTASINVFMDDLTQDILKQLKIIREDLIEFVNNNFSTSFNTISMDKQDFVNKFDFEYVINKETFFEYIRNYKVISEKYMNDVSEKISEDKLKIDNFINDFTKKIIESVDNLCDIFYDQAFKTYPLIKSLRKNHSYSIYEDDEEESNNEDNHDIVNENSDCIFYDKITKNYGLYNKKYAKILIYRNFNDLISGSNGNLIPFDFHFKDITMMNDYLFILDDNNSIKKIKDELIIMEKAFDLEIVKIEHTYDNKMIIIEKSQNMLNVDLYNENLECLENNCFDISLDFKSIIINDNIIYLVDLIETNAFPLQLSFYNNKTENNKINMLSFISIPQKKIFTFHKNPISLYICDKLPLSNDFKVIDDKLFFILAGKIIEYEISFTNHPHLQTDENIL